MGFREIVRVSLEALRVNKMRSALTMLASSSAWAP
jgi:hypothetical protein